MAKPQPMRITKKQRDELREPMLAAGVPHQVIKDEMVRRWSLRPRQAWRFAHGWSLEAMAAAYNARHDPVGRAPMSASRISAYERWPDKGERPTASVLLSIADLFDTTLDQVIDARDWANLSDADRLIIQDRTSTVTGAITSPPPGHPSTAYRYMEEADNKAGQGEVVTMAAHEGSEHAEHAERREVGDATLEQLHADVVRLSHDYMTSNPFPVFQDMRRVRRRIYTILDRKIWPQDERDLYFLLGVLNTLMGVAAHSLGNDRAAEELLRSGWAYATAIDHRPLKAQLRLQLSWIAYWDRPHQSRDLARNALEFQSAGPGAAQLHLQHGRAAARLGDVNTARRAIAAARDLDTDGYHDDILEIGGEFDLSQATQRLFVGSALLEIPGAGWPAHRLRASGRTVTLQGVGGRRAVTRRRVRRRCRRDGGIADPASPAREASPRRAPPHRRRDRPA